MAEPIRDDDYTPEAIDRAGERFRVSWIDGPSGRVIESFTRELRKDAEAVLLDLFPKIGADELLVFEVTTELE